jgi:hypothetical protein
MLVLMILPILAVSAEAQQSSSTGIGFREIRVPAANDEWTGTGFRIGAGDCLMFAAGPSKVRIGAGLAEVDANGNISGSGALRAKIGATTTFSIGMRNWFCATEDMGILKLKVNDTRYDDNSGEFVVDVMRVPAHMVPSVERYQDDQ